MRARAWLAGLAVTAAAGAACDKGEAKGGKQSGALAALGLTGVDTVVDAWKQAGLTLSALTPDKSGAIGADCRAGTASGVDVVICAFGSDAEAKAAEDKGYAWVGDATGTALARGRLLVAAADRRAADPSGRTINTIAKAFAGK